MPHYEAPAERYRRLAEEALDVARNFPHGEHRDALVEMAQVWQRLADTYAGGTVLHPPSGGADQPVMQQQQQVQPDEEKKE
jgi:hypothetical protein